MIIILILITFVTSKDIMSYVFMRDKVKSEKIPVYAPTNKKDIMEWYAEAMGMSNSQFLWYCYEWWREYSNHPDKIRVDIRKYIIDNTKQPK